MTKSNAGYVVVISDLAIHTTGFYFSKSFTDGFEKVAEMYTGHIRLWNVGKQELDYGLGLLLFGGYGATNTVKELIMSRDGGETYTTIHTLEPIQGQERCHYHASTFDRLTGRIYTSIGDIANAKVIYSDDFGSKWTEIPNTLPTPLQTTSLVNLANKLVLCPDRDGYYASIWTMTKGETSTINEIPKFDLAFNKKIANIKAQYQYVGYPFVVSNSGIECYVPFMDFGANNKTIYIVATNDGGETWHTILVDNYNDKFTANTFGILGYDKNGNLYMKYQGNNPEIRIFKGITWSNYRFANETNYELT